MIYFISGHRDLTIEEFNKIYIPKINEVLEKDPNAEFIVGDCEGVDKFAMDYVFNLDIEPPLTLCHMFKESRVFPKGYLALLKTHSHVNNFELIGNFKSDVERDTYMTEHSDFDIAYIKDNRWDSGTAQNLKRRYGM